MSRIWACIQFPRDYPEEMIHGRLTRPTQLNAGFGHKIPYINCNITSLTQDMFGRRIIQLNYESSDEKKLLRELDIMHGKVLDIQRHDVNQYSIQETNNNESGKTLNVHVVDEILRRGEL